MFTSKSMMLLLSIFSVSALATIDSAYANDQPYLILLPNELDQPFDIEPFISKQKIEIEPSLLIDTPRSTSDTSGTSASFKSNEDKQDFGDKVLAMVPHGKKMKKAWKVIDGDVDLYFEGLRADRGNKGLKYTTTAMPLIGEVSGTEFEFSAGEEMEFSFESNRIPLAGEIEGFRLKGSVGDDAKISARYTMKFD